MKSLRIPLLLFLAFWALGLGLWLCLDSLFYLFNFGYIGTAVGLGIGLYSLLPPKNKPWGRRFAQLLVGVYMLGFLGVVRHENMQVEGFFFYLLSGFFSGSMIHYLVAKIAGPLLFGRGFCGWACWTAMVLDFLPYRRNRAGRLKAGWEWIRYLHFAFSLALVLLLWEGWHYRPEATGTAALLWLVAGNGLYYLSAVILAFALKDNRAFCKYLCPVTVLLKIFSRFSLLKIRGDKESCTGCRACARACPMDIDVVKYVKNGQRVFSTECIVCLTCTTVCPEKILTPGFGLDMGGTGYLQRR